MTAATDGGREITLLRGDLYLVRDGQQYTVFVATSDGIILGDPLSRATALWLRDQISSQFGQNVRFVLHTWHSYTRAAGSSVFNDTAEIVAHATFNRELWTAQSSSPASYRFAFRATLLLAGERRVTLGGRTVALIHVPSTRTPEMAVLYYERERVVFAADPPAIGRVPFSFGTSDPGDVFAWLQTLAPLEFDSLVLSDGRIVARAEFDELAAYLSAVRDAIARGAKEGLTLDQIQASDALDQFRTNPHYANRASQLSSIYATVKSRTVWMSGGAATNYARLSPAFCAASTACAGGGSVPAARFTMSTALRKDLDLMGEATFSGQTWSARNGAEVDQEAATRRSRGALLVRFVRHRPPSRFSYAAVGGPSLTFDDVRGLDQVKDALVPVGGRHEIGQRNVKFGATFGGDLEYGIGHSITIRLPVRITRMFGQSPDAYTDSTLDVHAGIDVTFRLFNRVSFR